ncbi:MAG: Hpt domain-containing protein, partial [Treponema sp.]|nr:Hpt domain-containing protein [Treponema sp.]
GLAEFTAHVHALKSAAGTIGAAEVSKEAAALEAGGKAGDLKTIGESLPGFRTHLAELIAGIGKALEEQKAERDPKTGDGGEIVDLLSLLRAALEAKNMKEIDRLLAELEKAAVGAKTREGIEALSDRILMGEYKEAVDELDRLSAEPAVSVDVSQLK